MKILSFCNKLIAFSFYALFFLVPLIFAPNTSELFELNKMWITFGLTIIIMFAWSIKMIYERKIHIQKTPFDIPLLLFLLSQFISSVISLDQRVSFWGYYSRFNGGFFSTLCYVLLYYAFASNLSLKQTYKVLVVSVISGLLVSLWGFPSHFGKDPTCLLIRGTFDTSCWTDQFHPTVRIFSTLGQPAWIASYLAVILCILLGLSLLYIQGIVNKEQKNELLETFPPIKNSLFTFAGSIYVASALVITWYVNTYLWLHSFQGIIIFVIDSVILLLYIVVSVYFHKRTILPFALSSINLLIFFYLCLNYANTRAGYLAFWIGIFIFIGMVMAGYLYTKVKKHALISQKIVLLSVFSFCILFGVSFFLVNPFAQLQPFTYPYIKNNLTQQPEKKILTEAPKPTAGTVLESGGTESGSIRRIVWNGALTAWKNNPLFGTGVETFAFAYYKYRPVEHNLTSEWDYLYNKAHNEYLNYLATTGILGLGTYLLFIGWFFFITVKTVLTTKPHSANNILVFGLVSGFITILIANFFGFSVVITNLYLFLIPLFVLLLTNSLLPNKAFLFRFGEERKGTGLSPYQWTGVALLGLFSGYMLLSLMRFWYADTKYALGHNLNNVGEYSMAAPLLLNAVQIRPSEVVFTDELAINSASIAIAALKENAKQNATTASQLAQQALALSEQATQNHPNNILVWKNRVRVLYLLAQANPEFYKQALSAMLTSKQLAPTDAKISYNLGVLYGQIGDMQKGIDTLKETVVLKPNYRDAYFAMGLFYHELAMKDEKVVNPEMQKQAEETMQFILTNFNPKDKQVEETLTSWKGK